MNVECNGGVVALQAAVTMATVDAAQYRRFCQEMADSTVHTLDLAAVSRADSACVALLLAAMRIKQAQQQTLKLAHMPADLRMLTALYEIDPWITE